METIFLKLMNMSIVAGWLILAVILLRGLLKKVPKAIRCVLWALVAIRLVSPFSFESILSLVPSAETLPAESLYSKSPTIYSGVSAFNHVINPIFSETFSATTEASANPLQIIIYIASVVWIFGVGVMLIYGIVSCLQLRRQVHDSLRLRDSIWLCDNITTPFILGIVRPRIFLPSDISEKQLDYIVLHENAHLKRYDHWWKPLGFVLLAVYWFNPLIWLAYVLFCRDIELACDERVVREMGTEEKKAYSQVLLACSVARRMIAACPLAFGEVGVKGRIKTVLHYKKPALWMSIAAIFVCIAVAVCFLTNPKQEKANAGENINTGLDGQYKVERIIYNNGSFSYVEMPENVPLFYISDGSLLWNVAEDGEKNNSSWTYLGKFETITLKTDNFDTLFTNPIIWEAGITAADVRNNNAKAWKVTAKAYGNDIFFYLLLQEDGSVYLCRGFNMPEDTHGNPFIRWVQKLEYMDVSSVNTDVSTKHRDSKST